MTQFWVHFWPKMSTSNRASFSVFMAKLASVDILVSEDRCSIGLTLLCDALETPRALGTLADLGAGALASREPKDVSVVGHLPAVKEWLVHGGLKMIDMQNPNWNHGRMNNVAPGELFCIDQVLDGKPLPKFTVERWMFWLRRLHQLSGEALAKGDTQLAAYIRGLIDLMFLAANDATRSELRRQLQGNPEFARYSSMEHATRMTQLGFFALMGGER